ncbi:hypothetical protein CMV_027864 [Castanea mollissima]|uniref:NGN domain-containing protein n=1 Tax=Castanea mollissima TaxID=60419 RepID=A0A8J4QH75_9ROSI|nr:hypothetical protein CMV_027864 [Castanea mollissima]
MPPKLTHHCRSDSSSSSPIFEAQLRSSIILTHPFNQPSPTHAGHAPLQIFLHSFKGSVKHALDLQLQVLDLVKICKQVGRERNSAFCLMQKYVDLKSLGTKLQIISAFALDHIKGCIYIEADKQFDIIEACKGLTTIYSSRIATVPKNEVFLITINK